MRVIEPKHRRSAKTKKEKHHDREGFLAAILILVLLGGIWYIGYRSFIKPDKNENQQTIAQKNEALTQEPAKKGVLKTYTGQQFKELYEKFAYPNTQRIDENSPITGVAPADTKIKTLAGDRGYIVRSAPVTDVFRTVAPGFMLQERAAQPWIEMQAKAKQEGILLALSAAYRSADDQKQIFFDRLQAAGVNINQIAGGNYDAQINKVLAMTAPPGYSRHHSGYTIDITCQNDPYVTFEKSLCFDWLSADNYRQTKEFGWIPSYPEDSSKQGPEPEAWEYVWVGRDTLTE